jgi:hypothetical protein
MEKQNAMGEDGEARSVLSRRDCLAGGAAILLVASPGLAHAGAGGALPRPTRRAAPAFRPIHFDK